MAVREEPVREEPWVAEQTDQMAGGEYDPRLYEYRGSVPKVAGPLANIDEPQIKQYHDDGYLAVDEAFSFATMVNAKAGIDRLLSGTVSDFHGVQWEGAARDRVASMSAGERRDAVRKLIHYVDYEPQLRAIAQDPDLLRVVSRLMDGEEPVLIQDQALLKPPGIGREKPWHQDLSHGFDIRPGFPLVGVWIAIDRALPDNGCMHVIPGSHKAGPVVHFTRRDLQICDGSVDVEHVYAVPLDPGGALFFDGLLHHATPTNKSPLRRWALQLHYVASGGLWSSLRERESFTQWRTEAFGADGTGATC